MAVLKKINNLSCKTKIILPFVSILTIFAISLSFLLHQTLVKQEKNRLKKEIRILGARLPVEISDATAPGKLLVNSLAGLNNFQFAVALKDKNILKESISPLVKTLSESKALSGFFTVYDSEGSVIFSTNPVMKPGSNPIKNRPTLVRAISSRKEVSGIEPGKDGLLLRCLAPVTYNGMFSGVLEFDIPMMQVFSKIKGQSDEISIAWLIDKTLAKDLGLQGTESGGKVLGGATKDFDKAYASLLETMTTGNNELVVESNGKAAIASLPLHFFGDKGKASVVIKLDNMGSWQALNSAIWKLVIGFALIALVSAVITNISIGLITRPLFLLLDYMQELAHGRFLKASYYQADDELGLLHKMANKVMAGTGKFCWHVKKDLETLMQGAASLNGATQSLQQESSVLNEVAHSVRTEIDQATSALSAIQEATDILQNSASTISDNVIKTAEIASEASNRADTTTNIIHNLEMSSEKISDIIEVIKRISEQTNLLALNATIEAARAGEAGKGFAVVANEVKELAKQTGDATDEITNMIQAIQKDTKASVEAVDEITDVIGEAARLSNTAAAATEEQNATIAQMHEHLDLVTNHISILNSSAQSLHDQANKLSNVADQIVSAHKGVLSTSEELDEFVSKYQVDLKAVEEAKRLSQ